MAIQALFSSSGTYSWPAAARMLPPAQALDAALVGALTANVVRQAGASRAASGSTNAAAPESSAAVSSSASATSSASTTYTAGPAAAAQGSLALYGSTAAGGAATESARAQDAAPAESDPAEEAKAKEKKAATGAATELSPEARAVLARLAARDQEVRQHEQAHMAAAGGLVVSGASYSYQRGPDGKNYAVGGEVSIDVSPGNSPEETIERARTIQAAALAPADPSSQDRAVAAQAAQMEAEARRALAQQRADERAAEQKAAVARRYGELDDRDGERRQVNIFA